MDENIKGIFKEQYSKLPPELQKAIMASDLQTKLTSLTQKYRLHIDKASVLENEVVLVLMGMENPDEFVNNSRRELGISPEDARSLARDVNDQIFHPIREKLESFINAQTQAYIAANPAPTFPSQGEASSSTTPQSIPTAPKTPASPDRYREPVDDSLPQAIVTPLPAVPKNIIADKLGVSLGTIGGLTKESVAPTIPPKETPKAPMNSSGSTPLPVVAPTPAPASINLKSFGIKIGEEKIESKLPVADIPTTAPETTSQKTETPPVKPSVDPYREIV